MLDGGSPEVGRGTHILMLEVLQELEFSVCPLCEHRCAEGLHDLLDGYSLPRELVLGRTAFDVRRRSPRGGCCTYQTRPKAPMPTGWSSAYLGLSVNALA